MQMMEVVQVLSHSSNHAFIFVNAFKRFAVGPLLMVEPEQKLNTWNPQGEDIHKPLLMKLAKIYIGLRKGGEK